MAIDKESSRIKAGCPKLVLWGNREGQDGEGGGALDGGHVCPYG